MVGSPPAPRTGPARKRREVDVAGVGGDAGELAVPACDRKAGCTCVEHAHRPLADPSFRSQSMMAPGSGASASSPETRPREGAGELALRVASGSSPETTGRLRRTTFSRSCAVTLLRYESGGRGGRSGNAPPWPGLVRLTLGLLTEGRDALPASSGVLPGASGLGNDPGPLTAASGLLTGGPGVLTSGRGSPAAASGRPRGRSDVLTAG
jgi:hypothetical protein